MGHRWLAEGQIRHHLEYRYRQGVVPTKSPTHSASQHSYGYGARGARGDSQPAASREWLAKLASSAPSMSRSSGWGGRVFSYFRGKLAAGAGVSFLVVLYGCFTRVSYSNTPLGF